VIDFTCPNCNKRLRAPEGKAGARLTCPGCKQPITVPDEPPVLEVLPVEEAAPQGRTAGEAAVERDDGTQRDDWVYYLCLGCKGRLRAPAADARLKGVCPSCRQVATVPTRMHLRRASGGQRRGMAYRDCPTCKTHLELPEAELGGMGPCPSCGELVIYAKTDVVDKDSGPRRPDMVHFVHPPCNSDLRCVREEAGTYATCPVCSKLCRVPRWASIQRDDRTRQDQRVYWRCAGCNTDLQADRRYEGANGLCPGCKTSLAVPRRGQTERDDGKAREGWAKAVCNSCRTPFRYPATDAGAIGVCPGCNRTIKLAEAGRPEVQPVQAVAARPADGVAAEVNEITEALLLKQPDRRFTQALIRLVGTCHPTLGRGGIALFADMQVICDTVRVQCRQDCGQMLYVWPPMLFAGTPVNLVFMLRAHWKGWHPEAFVEGYLDTGVPVFNEVVFQERSLRAYPDHPAEFIKGLIGHRQHMVEDTSQQPGCMMLLFPALYKCPSCKKWMAWVYESSIGVDARQHTENRLVEDSVQMDAKGYIVGRTYKKVQVDVATVRLVNLYRCRYCNYLWGSMGQKKGDIS
jgi:hypothetical protein